MRISGGGGREHRGGLIGSGLEILKAEDAKIQLDLFSPLKIGDLVRLPNTVRLLPQKRF